MDSVLLRHTGVAEVRRAPPSAAPAVTEPRIYWIFFKYILNFLTKVIWKKENVALKIQFSYFPDRQHIRLQYTLF